MLTSIGIVGHGADKFTAEGERLAREEIRRILSSHPHPVLVSGHSPVGGIDIWAEEVARAMGIPMDIKAPKTHTWNGEYGYRERNLDIAKSSSIIYIIVVSEYPKGYRGMRFDECYHCHSKSHVKSGGCWTGLQARSMGRRAVWITLTPDGRLVRYEEGIDWVAEAKPR
jgi:hypothetical protein